MTSPRKRRAVAAAETSSTAGRAAGRTAGLTEREWQAQVVSLATLLGWSHYHTADSRRSPAGFPDLVLWRPGDRLIMAELKTDTGKLRPDQTASLSSLSAAGVEVYLWRPLHFDSVRDVLTRRAA